MSDLTELLEQGDADLREQMGESVTYTAAGSSAGVTLTAVLSPLPESVELDGLGGSEVTSMISAHISKSHLVDEPSSGGRVETASGRVYIIDRVESSPWDSSWHLTLREGEA